MEDQGAERSSSPSGSEDVDSDDESKHDDAENGKESDENEENGKDDDSDSEASDASREADIESPGKSGEDSKCEEGGYDMDEECYPLADLPLEVITTVEPTNYACPVLENIPDSVLTYRNIFTESERSILFRIINKYRDIVDTRKRSREIFLQKQNVWKQIVEEYNGIENMMVRKEKELRKCWDNMKYRAKQAEKEMVKTEEPGTEEGSVQVKVGPPEQDTSTFTSG